MGALSEEYILDNLMGPNAVVLLRELLQAAPIGATDDASRPPRVCDLGCGKGLTSMALAEATDAQVWGCDLWIPEDENRARFEQLGFGTCITPVGGDVFDLSFPDGFFDALVSVDSYHYFGREDGALDRLARLVAPGGRILLAMPGVVRPLDDAMIEVFVRSWSREDMDAFWTMDQWEALFARSELVAVERVFEMECFDRAWDDWLNCDNEFARGDRAAMESGGRELMNLIGAVLVRR